MKHGENLPPRPAKWRVTRTNFEDWNGSFLTRREVLRVIQQPGTWVVQPYYRGRPGEVEYFWGDEVTIKN